MWPRALPKLLGYPSGYAFGLMVAYHWQQIGGSLEDGPTDGWYTYPFLYSGESMDHWHHWPQFLVFLQVFTKSTRTCYETDFVLQVEVPTAGKITSIYIYILGWCRSCQFLYPSPMACRVAAGLLGPLSPASHESLSAFGGKQAGERAGFAMTARPRKLGIRRDPKTKKNIYMSFCDKSYSFKSLCNSDTKNVFPYVFLTF